MNSHIKIRLRFKIAIISFIIAGLGVTAVSWVGYKSMDTTLQNHAMQSIIHNVRWEKQRLSLLFSTIKKDVLFLSYSLPEIHMAGDSRLLGPYEERTNRQRISSIFSAVMQEVSFYTSIRFVLNDTLGMEAVNLRKKGEQIIPAPLKPLGKEPYFKQILSMKKGSIFSSDIASSPTENTILRFATPVYGSDNQISGVILVEADLLRMLAPPTGHTNGVSFFIADSQGNYLPRPGRGLHNVNVKEEKFQDEYPTQNMDPSEKDSFSFNNSQKSGYATRLYFAPQDPEKFITIGSATSFSHLKKEPAAHGHLIFTVAGITLIFQFISSALGAIMIARPIKRLNRIINGEKNLVIPIDGRDDVADPSISLKAILKTLLVSRNKQKRFNRSLEDEVTARTSACAEANRKLQDEISARNKMEESLKLYRKFFNESCEAMVVTDTNSTILEVNEAFVEMAGYPREVILGQNPRILKSGRHEPDFYEKMWDEISSHGYWRGEIWDRRKNGEVYPKWMSISTLKNKTGKITHFVALSTDITTVKNAEKQLAYLANYDQLTNTPNRVLLKDRIQNAIINAERNDCKVAVMVIDLDRFKGINDMFGHNAGDNLLIETANRLSRTVRKSDTVARLGGDEFAVVIDEVDIVGNAAICAEKLLNSLARPFILDGQDIYISASIGISIYPSDSTDAEELLKKADTAMHYVKQKETNNFLFFSKELNAEAGERLLITAMLKKAMEKKELSLNYQPKVDVTTGRITGMEALLRWNHPEHGFISPGKFIPVAEDTGLIIPIGTWVLQEACTQAKLWFDQGLTDLKISVNLSARQLQLKDTIIGTVGGVLHKTGLPAECLELEITESMLMPDVEETIRILSILRDMGVGLAIDDFGTGYSSLSYLKRFPIDVLKIDRSFIKDLPKDSNDRAVVASIIDMAKNMNLKVIAEGVEEIDQFSFLEKHGCNEIQGFIFSKPLPAEEFSSFVKNFDMGRYLNS